MKTIETDSFVDQLISQWKAAKEAERKWVAHRLYLEEQIKEQMQEPFEALKEGLTGLSETAKLGAIEVHASREFETDQAEAALLLGLYPQLNGVVICTKYEPVARGALAALAKPETELGKHLGQTLKFKPAKIYFRG